jgi:hypothetical protein
MPVSPGQTDWLSPDAATAERLLSGYGANPGAPSEDQALALVLAAAARPATARELSGEQAAVAAFELAISGSRSATWAWKRPGARTGRRRRPRRVSVLVAGGALAVVAALGGTAAANALPAPLQKMAHTVFGAPAPAPAAPGPSVSPGSAPAGNGPRPAASPSPAQSPRAKAAQKKAKAKAKGRKKAASTPTSTPSSSNSQGNGKTKTKTKAHAKKTDESSTGNGQGTGRSRGPRSATQTARNLAPRSRQVKKTAVPAARARPASAPPAPPSHSPVRPSGHPGTARARLRR